MKSPTPIRDEGLHAFLEMVEYCMKDNDEQRFEVMHHNVSAKDMNEETMEYAKFGKNNCKSLSHNNMWKGFIDGYVYVRRKHLGVSLSGTLFHMCKSRQLFPNPTWVILLRYTGIDVKRVASMWKSIINPRDVVMHVISNVFFDIVMEMSNMKYFKAQELAHTAHDLEKLHVIAMYVASTLFSW